LTNIEEWNNNLKFVEDYIIKNDTRPSINDKDKNIKKLGLWIGTQQQNYLKNEYIMNDESIKQKWKDFIDKYIQFFLTNIEEWNNNLKFVEDYIIKNDKRPSGANKDKNIKKLGSWIANQQKNYSKNEQIMKNEDVRIKWKDFTDKYIQYFK